MEPATEEQLLKIAERINYERRELFKRDEAWENGKYNDHLRKFKADVQAAWPLPTHPPPEDVSV